MVDDAGGQVYKDGDTGEGWAKRKVKLATESSNPTICSVFGHSDKPHTANPKEEKGHRDA